MKLVHCICFRSLLFYVFQSGSFNHHTHDNVLMLLLFEGKSTKNTTINKLKCFFSNKGETIIIICDAKGFRC